MTTTTSHNPSYTFLKQGIYYFSKRIPTDLQQHYRQPRVVQPLKTRSVKEAAKTGDISLNALKLTGKNLGCNSKIRKYISYRYMAVVATAKSIDMM